MYLKCSPTWELFFYGLEVPNLQACSHVGDHGPHVGMQVQNVFLKATLMSHWHMSMFCQCGCHKCVNMSSFFWGEYKFPHFKLPLYTFKPPPLHPCTLNLCTLNNNPLTSYPKTSLTIFKILKNKSTLKKEISLLRMFNFNLLVHSLLFNKH